MIQECNEKSTHKYKDNFDRNTSFTVFVLLNAALEHLTIIVGTGAGHLPTKIAPRAEHLTNFFVKSPGFARDACGWN